MSQHDTQAATPEPCLQSPCPASRSGHDRPTSSAPSSPRSGQTVEAFHPQASPEAASAFNEAPFLLILVANLRGSGRTSWREFSSSTRHKAAPRDRPASCRPRVMLLGARPFLGRAYFPLSSTRTASIGLPDILVGLCGPAAAQKASPCFPFAITVLPSGARTWCFRRSGKRQLRQGANA